MKKNHVTVSLVYDLIGNQFPQFKDLPVYPVQISGWDNKTFHLGKEMLVRLPSHKIYEIQVEKEHLWLLQLAPRLPLSIPEPLYLGQPTEDYPLKWSIYRWLKGETATSANVKDEYQFAKSLAEFLKTLQKIDISNGPLHGEHNFHRGGSLETYDKETRHAIALLKDKIDTRTVIAIWNNAISTHWIFPPVWVHGDISAGNLLVFQGKLASVIDFGMLGIGDPACDLVIAWTMLKNKSRRIFQNTLSFDSDTWNRGRAWALWKALIVHADLVHINLVEKQHSLSTLHTIIEDYKNRLR